MTINLKNWKQTLRPYQAAAVARALDVRKGGRKLFVAPTGTGKGTMQLGLLSALRAQKKDAWIVTPSLEVVRGYLERCGATVEDLSGGAGALSMLGQRIFVTTPIRLRNRLESEQWSAPSVIILDEAHHATLDNVTGGELRELCPGATWIGWTATPYRGSPEETQELRDYWGEPDIIIDIPTAIESGAWCLPKWRVEPLVNDDELALKGGDIDADEANLETADALAALVASLDLTLPTCVTTTSVKAAEELGAKLEALGVQSRTVLGTTPTTERGETFALCSKGGTVLVSVKVLGEGVDLPWLRRWVDASPTLSPVAFMQKLGRITRPFRDANGNEVPAEYLGTNRNLERHGYLLQGKLPRAEIKIAQERFGGPSIRIATTRVRFLKSAGKVKPIELPLADGVMGTMYALWCPSKTGGSGFERCIILDPTSDAVVSAIREVDPSKKEAKERWGPWQIEEKAPDKIEGFKASKLGGPCSRAQANFWDLHADNRGLDRTVKPTKAQFFALPMLVELNGTLRGGLKFSPKPAQEAPAPAPEKKAAPAPGQPEVPDGYYTVVYATGHKTYRVRTQPKDSTFCPGQQVLSFLFGPDNLADYQGVAFVEGLTLRVWKKAEGRRPDILADWAVITGDVQEAGKAYALKSGRCFSCSRVLTTPESIETGLGPECAEKMGEFWGRKTQPAKEVPDDVQIDHSEEINRVAKREAFKQVETANESNIPLMERLLKENTPREKIVDIYLARYEALGKGETRGRKWIEARVKTYAKIAKENLRKQGIYVWY